MNRKALTLSTILLASLLLQGCIVVDREGPANITSRGTTVGAELEDLNEAYEEGLLSQQEYNRLRNRILDF
jgi:outer membrane murein-binding lipoprotein Lpp